MKSITHGKDARIIRDMFALVARKYDQANSVLSLGIHHLWRNRVVRAVNLQPGERALDCATGTGDLAVKLKASCKQAQVIGTDFCDEMLQRAPQKARDYRVNVQFLIADVMQLPFPDGSFDAVTISFGIRNVADPRRAIQEMARVLKPNGRLIILEFGQPDIPIISDLYRFYSEKILPYIGGLVTGQRQAYKYLQTSSKEFPCGNDFLQLIDESFPFQKTSYETLSGGIAYMYRARRMTQSSPEAAP